MTDNPKPFSFRAAFDAIREGRPVDLPDVDPAPMDRTFVFECDPRVRDIIADCAARREGPEPFGGWPVFLAPSDLPKESA